MRVLSLVSLAALLVLANGSPGAAQQKAPVTETTIADRHDVINEKEHHYTGNVEIEMGDTKLYADDIRLYVDENRAVASGNVVFRQGGNQISADRADFDTRTRLGTFTRATGFATVQPPRRPVGPGVVAPPPMSGEDTNVYFFGETVEKIGPRKYKITDGGFTTCVQPTPRWDFHADTIVLNLDHYTLLRNVVMTVKGVPLLYLPALYYPTNREDRATGFLLPTYGTSSLRGQSLHNAFFWAINRSQDATFMHDWFSKAGQGVGTEYRYNFGAGSDGVLRAHVLDQRPSSGSDQSLSTERSYKLNGAVSQRLPGRLRGSVQIDYFSSIATNQTFNTDFNEASNSRRSFGGNVAGSWNSYSVNARVQQTEYFSSSTVSSLTGNRPRVAVTRNERPVPNTPFYFSTTGEYASLLSQIQNNGDSFDQNLTRIDFAPQVRVPFTKLQWLTINSTASWRDTYYSRSYLLDPLTNQPATDPVTDRPTIVGDNLNRQYFTVQSQVTGPVFNRIWDTPGNGYAEKFKHSIEPYLTILRTSTIDNQAKIVKLDGNDFTVGGDIQYTYGLTNRIYAKRPAGSGGQAAQAREILTVDLRQVYYSKPEASRADPQNSSSGTGPTSDNFSPVLLTIRTQPTADFNATARAEFDSRYHELRTLTASGTYSWSTQLQSSLSWSKRAFIAERTGFNDPRFLDHSLNGTTTVRTRNNKYGAIYSFNYDALRSRMIQQRMSGFYNAQCCGVAFEYQKIGGGAFSIPSDRRFFMSFTLAGLGNFSPFNGALGGVPR